MKEYTVKIGGLEHTVQLSDEDAKAQGLTGDAVESKQADKPANKQASKPADK